MKKLQSITDKLYSITAIGLLVILWQAVSLAQLVPSFMLPSPVEVVRAFLRDLPLLMMHARVTLFEAFLGLMLGIVLGFVIALLMDLLRGLRKALYPLLVVTQTVPTVAIAPLLVLWFGYGIFPKVVLIVLTTFFPIAIGLFDGFQSVDPDAVNLMRSMGASRMQIFRHIKLPGATNSFFAALKISASYSIVGAVISEWLGGFTGLGVYMTRVIKSYPYDKMFAVIFLISGISLVLMALVKFLHRRMTPWDQPEADSNES